VHDSDQIAILAPAPVCEAPERPDVTLRLLAMRICVLRLVCRTIAHLQGSNVGLR
jgi:hypothetical protein